MDPLSLLSRLATAVPPPRLHTVRYAGVLAPASKLRPNRSGRSPALLDGGYVGPRRANTACWPEVQIVPKPLIAEGDADNPPEAETSTTHAGCRYRPCDALG